MPHIDLGNDIPGIGGLLAYRPETAKPLRLLANALLHTDEGLSQGERETIAAFVSSLNECKFCTDTHTMLARLSLGENEDIVEAVKTDYSSAPVSDKLKALLAIAKQVQSDARKVSPPDVDKAKAVGASDLEIYVTVTLFPFTQLFLRLVISHHELQECTHKFRTCECCNQPVICDGVLQCGDSPSLYGHARILERPLGMRRK